MASVTTISAYFSQNRGYQIHLAKTAGEAISLLRLFLVDVIVSESGMKDTNGITLLEHCKKTGNNTPIILFTSQDRPEKIIEALNSGADFYLLKEDLSSRICMRLEEFIRIAAERKQKERLRVLNEMKEQVFIECYAEQYTYTQILLDAIPVPVFYRDTHGVYRNCNRAFEILLGRQKKEILKKSIDDLFPGDLAEHYRQMDELILENPNIQQYEYGIADKKGVRYDALFSKSAIINSDGTIWGIVGVIFDISDRKKLEWIIIENEEKYRTLADYTYDWESWISPEGEYIYISPSCERITGYRPEEFTRDPELVIRITHPDDRKMIERHYKNIPLQHEEIHHMDYRIITKSGEERWLSHYTQSVFRDDGSWLGRRENRRDITFRKEITAAYELANTKLNLLSSITRHDILNQLTVLNGIHDLLIDISDDREIHQGLQRVKSAIDTMTKQISFTRIYQDIGLHAPQWQHIPPLIEKASQGIDIPKIEISPELTDIDIFADPLLERVFFCLLDNTQRHGKTVSYARFSSQVMDKRLKLVYTDDGIGISDGEKERVFERGYGNNTGYGLFLVREILSISHFAIFEKGKKGTGVLFEIYIPEGYWRKESPKGISDKEQKGELIFMQKMKCSICGHVYDPDAGDKDAPPGTDFNSLPPDWACPICFASKGLFKPI